MQIVDTVDQYRAFRQSWAGQTIGFVPTMGALHKGHESLISRSCDECDITVVSVYVNPTQFDNPRDLNRYPVMLEQDSELCEAMGATLLFAPNYNDIYPDQFRYQVDETAFSTELCGEHRPGHFTGVLTVVMKLLNIVRPDRAYFGEKDYQQLELIKGMVDAFFLEVDVVGCPTVREADGLALSSRNLNLSREARAVAPALYRLIASDHSDEFVKDALHEAGFDVDYVVTKRARRFVAARVGKGAAQVRLIDNVPLAGATP